MLIDRRGLKLSVGRNFFAMNIIFTLLLLLNTGGISFLCGDLAHRILHDSLTERPVVVREIEVVPECKLERG